MDARRRAAGYELRPRRPNVRVVRRARSGAPQLVALAPASGALNAAGVVQLELALSNLGVWAVRAMRDGPPCQR